ncbi:hypothetical protein ES703_87167 [subsurface metagenome]
MKLSSIYRQSEGFSLLELVVALAITSLVLTGIMVTIFQLVFHREYTQDSMIATEQVRSAHYWISLDGLMSQNIEIGDDPETTDNEILTLLWIGFERRDAQDNKLADLYEVRYTYDGDEIHRIKNVTTEKYDSDGNLLDLYSSNFITIVARNITDLTMSFNNLTLNVSLTAVIGDVQNTKSFKVSPRIVANF